MKTIFYFISTCYIWVAACNITAKYHPLSNMGAELNMKRLKLPIEFCESETFARWDIRLDTITVANLRLTNGFDSVASFPSTSYKDFKCSPIGYYTINDYTILVYKALTSTAGDGWPEVLLKVLNKNNVVIDSHVILWNCQLDDFHKYQNCCKILDSTHFSIYLLETKTSGKNSNVSDTLPDIYQTIQYFVITTDGRIKQMGDSTSHLTDIQKRYKFQ